MAKISTELLQRKVSVLDEEIEKAYQIIEETDNVALIDGLMLRVAELCVAADELDAEINRINKLNEMGGSK